MAENSRLISYEPGNAITMTPTSTIQYPGGKVVQVDGQEYAFPTSEAAAAANARLRAGLQQFQVDVKNAADKSAADAKAANDKAIADADAASKKARDDLNAEIARLKARQEKGDATAARDLANTKETQRLLNAAVAQGGALNEQEIAQVMQAIGTDPVGDQERISATKDTRAKNLIRLRELAGGAVPFLDQYGPEALARQSSGTENPEFNNLLQYFRNTPAPVTTEDHVKQTVAGFQAARDTETARRKSESEAALNELNTGLGEGAKKNLALLTPQIEQEYTQRGLYDSGAFQSALARAAEALAARQAETVAGARYGEFQNLRGMSREDFLRNLEAAKQNRLLEGERAFQQTGYEQQAAERAGQAAGGFRQALLNAAMQGQGLAQQGSEFNQSLNQANQQYQAGHNLDLQRLALAQSQFDWQKANTPSSFERILSGLLSGVGTVAGGYVGAKLGGGGGGGGYSPRAGDYSTYPPAARNIAPNPFEG